MALPFIYLKPFKANLNFLMKVPLKSYLYLDSAFFFFLL